MVVVVVGVGGVVGGHGGGGAGREAIDGAGGGLEAACEVATAWLRWQVQRKRREGISCGSAAADTLATGWLAAGSLARAGSRRSRRWCAGTARVGRRADGQAGEQARHTPGITQGTHASGQKKMHSRMTAVGKVGERE